MKQIECPHCKGQIKIRTRISMTVDDGKPKETIPREALNAIIAEYYKLKGFTFSEKAYLINAKPAKELYFKCDKDVTKALDMLKKCKEVAETNNWADWTIFTIFKRWETMSAPTKNVYSGWGE